MMIEKSRTSNSIRNVVVAVSCQLATLLLSFITRTLFIRILGTDYLGINGLFSNILTVMSLADLGFGTAIVYTLYKPLMDNDQRKISAIINYYGKIYTIVAVIMLIVGIGIVPFLKYLVNLENELPFLYLYYILFLMDSVCSYLYVYKSAVLEADQKNYIVKTNRTTFLLITNIVKLIVLYFTRNYFSYLIVQIIGTLISNISIYRISEKKYPYLRNSKEQLGKTEKKGIIDNVKSLFLYKIGGVILNSTDNILISAIVSTTVVGLYSNYSLLFGTVVTFSEIIFGALNASIGNLNASKTRNEVYKTFKMINFLNFWLYGFCSITLFCVMDDFIYLWLGNQYVLGPTTTLIICLNVFMPGMLSAVGCFRNATGLFKQTKYIFCITALLNLVLSIWFGKMWGLNGIILATSVARILTNVWFEPYMLIKKYFSQSYIRYFIRLVFYYLVTLLFIFVIYEIKKRVFVLTPVTFIVELFLCICSINIVFFFLFFKTEEFKGLVERLKPFLIKFFRREKL